MLQYIRPRRHHLSIGTKKDVSSIIHSEAELVYWLNVKHERVNWLFQKRCQAIREITHVYRVARVSSVSFIHFVSFYSKSSFVRSLFLYFVGCYVRFTILSSDLLDHSLNPSVQGFSLDALFCSLFHSFRFGFLLHFRISCAYTLPGRFFLMLFTLHVVNCVISRMDSSI